VDSTSRTLRLKITVDGTSIYDVTSGTITSSGRGLIGIGSAYTDAGSTSIVTFQPIRYNATFKVEIASSLGETDKLTAEWVDGIFATMWQKFNDRNRKDIMWIVCDGPVDALWIENLNTVLDDNKILTLANGDRIPMTDNVKIMFENESLANASPATVSRAGIIYVSETDLDWKPVADAWVVQRPPEQQPLLRALFVKLVGENSATEMGHAFDFIARSCAPVMGTSRVGVVSGLFNLLGALLERPFGVRVETGGRTFDGAPSAMAADDERALLPTQPLDNAKALAAYLAAKAAGTTALLGADQVVADLGDGCAALRPAVHVMTSPDPDTLNTELPFPCVWVSGWSRDAGIAPLRHSLVVTAITGDEGLVDTLLAEPTIGNVYRGDHPTWYVAPGMPHDGFLADVLMRTKGFARD
jgi:hypothetical protein